MNEDSKFFLIANNVAIDFINTQLLERTRINELLNGMQDVRDWAYASGFKLDCRNEGTSISKVLELRDALHALFLSKLDNRKCPSQALAVLNINLLNWPAQQQLTDKNGELKLQPLTNVLTVGSLLGMVAHEAAALLESTKFDLVRRCSNSHCKLIFLDISRSKK